MSASGSAAQFGDRYDHGPETPWRDHTEKISTTYKVTAPRHDDPFLVPGAFVTVAHPHTTYYPAEDFSGDSLDTHGDLTRHQIGDGPGGQGSLFGVRHMNPHVSYMETHPQFRAHIPTLLSVAALETQSRFREPLRSDWSLSDRASKIVHRLTEAGAVDRPTNEMRNSIEPDPEMETGSRRTVGKTSEVPESTVTTAKQQLRQALRRPKKAVQRGVAVAGDKKAAKQERMF